MVVKSIPQIHNRTKMKVVKLSFLPMYLLLLSAAITSGRESLRDRSGQVD